MGFGYTGLQDGLRCICMNERPVAEANDTNCNLTCSGNANFTCGGDWKVDVYQNPDYIPEPDNLTYIGCFKNSLNDFDRMIFEGTYNNFRNNTPEW